MDKIVITKSSEETTLLGEEMAKNLKGGDVIALYGELGSGKTTFMQGVAKGLGIHRRIVSPTFIVLRTYKLKVKSQKSKVKTTNKNLKFFHHVDLYRIEGQKDIQSLGIEEIMKDQQNIVAIEWAGKMDSLLPKEKIDIHFEYVEVNKRKITIITSGIVV